VFVYFLNLIIIKKSEFPLSDVNILIIGDSHNGNAINPKLFKDTYNISSSGESFVPTYYKLKKIISECSVDTILLSLSPHNLSAFNEKKYLDKNKNRHFFNCYHTLFNKKSLKNLKINFFDFYKIHFYRMALLPHSNHLDLMIGSFRESKKNILDIDKIDERIKKHFFNGSNLFDISETMISHLDSIIKICEQNSIKLYLVSTPLHKRYYQAIPKKFKDEFEIQIERLNISKVSVLDYTDAFKENFLFRDGDHLNIYGADKFTKIIKNRLKEN
jgi:hypothetical protein